MTDLADLVIRGARVVPSGGRPTLPRADVVVERGVIAAIVPGRSERGGRVTIEAGGRVLLPGFVDSHTHAIYAGDRTDEFEARLQGVAYLELLARGGGILATVRAVRAASEAELCGGLRERLFRMLHAGTTTVEVKSGYGLSTRDELKLLFAIAGAAASFPGTVVPTALLGHALDPDVPDFVGQVIERILPAVHEAFPGITIDAFCEEGAWSVESCVRLFRSACTLGHPFRVHVDQFHALGMLDEAISLGARSVDHLEATSVSGLRRVAAAGIHGVMLPASGFETDGRYANARAFLDAGGGLVLATNHNPGTSTTLSIPFVLALAVRKLGISFEEALAAVTSSAACLLGLTDRGVVEVGRRADLVLVRHLDERRLAYEIGGDPVDVVIAGGLVVRPDLAAGAPGAYRPAP